MYVIQKKSTLRQSEDHMNLDELERRVLSEGACSEWRHGASNQAQYDLSNLKEPARAVFDYSKRLAASVQYDDQKAALRHVFAILQNIYPIVETLDTDAGQYIAQAAEALRKP
jgi:hypothetical protein